MPKWLEQLSVLVGLGGLIGAGLYVVNVEWRLKSLEAQSLVWAVTAPTAALNEAQGVVDPIAVACAEVSKKLSDSASGFGPKVDTLQEQLRLLGCSAR